jgi:hypothetical protein
MEADITALLDNAAKVSLPARPHPVCNPPGTQHRRGTARVSISHRLMDFEQREPARLQRGASRCWIASGVTLATHRATATDPARLPVPDPRFSVQIQTKSRFA